MIKNAELSYCKECKEPSTAEFDDACVPKCGACGSYALIDMSDGGKFIAVIEGDE